MYTRFISRVSIVAIFWVYIFFNFLYVTELYLPKFFKKKYNYLYRLYIVYQIKKIFFWWYIILNIINKILKRVDYFVLFLFALAPFIAPDLAALTIFLNCPAALLFFLKHKIWLKKTTTLYTKSLFFKFDAI